MLAVAHSKMCDINFSRLFNTQVQLGGPRIKCHHCYRLLLPFFFNPMSVCRLLYIMAYLISHFIFNSTEMWNLWPAGQIQPRELLQLASQARKFEDIASCRHGLLHNPEAWGLGRHDDWWEKEKQRLCNTAAGCPEGTWLVSACTPLPQQGPTWPTAASSTVTMLQSPSPWRLLPSPLPCTPAWIHPA